LPVVAPGGTTAEIVDAVRTENDALVPLNVTDDTPMKLFPVIETVVPSGPEVGRTEATVGDTRKLPTEIAAPPLVVTAMGPLVAPAGTCVETDVGELTVNVAPTPLNVTAVAPTSPEPVIVTAAPTAPAAGRNEATVGTTVKVADEVAVPDAVLTVTLPVVAAAGTEVEISVDDLTLNFAAAPLKATAVTPLKPVPVMATGVPVVAFEGVNFEIVTVAASAGCTDVSTIATDASTATAARPTVRLSIPPPRSTRHRGGIRLRRRSPSGASPPRAEFCYRLRPGRS